MTRLAAFSFLTLAAFAVSVPWLDRAGVAALGFAFLALSVGRARERRRAVSGPAGALGDLLGLDPAAEPEDEAETPSRRYGGDGWQ